MCVLFVHSSLACWVFLDEEFILQFVQTNLRQLRQLGPPSDKICCGRFCQGRILNCCEDEGPDGNFSHSFLERMCPLDGQDFFTVSGNLRVASKCGHVSFVCSFSIVPYLDILRLRTIFYVVSLLPNQPQLRFLSPIVLGVSILLVIKFRKAYNSQATY